MKKINHTLQDLMMDDSFCDWVRGLDPEADGYWLAWMNEHPEKAVLVRQAKKLILELNEDANQLKENEKAKMWASISARRNVSRMYVEQSDYKYVGSYNLQNWKFVSRVAASFAAILILGVVFFWAFAGSNQQVVQYATKYGETKNIMLPDGSEVVLNANSALSFDKEWDNNTAREVKLDGEAFFSVVHKANNQKFQVRLTDNSKVEVLGTKFTATNRRHKTRVVLNEGKVKMVLFKEKLFGLISTTQAEETLKPGELLEVSEQRKEFLKRKVANPESFAAFRHNKIIFNDAPLSEVARELEDSYGYKVTFENPDMLQRRFTGTVATDQIDVLMVSMEKLFNVNIIQDGNKITIN